jgi:hypothetical protein
MRVSFRPSSVFLRCDHGVTHAPLRQISPGPHSTLDSPGHPQHLSAPGGQHAADPKVMEIVPVGQQMCSPPTTVIRGFGQHVSLPFQEAHREVLCGQHLPPQHPNSAQHAVPQHQGLAAGQHFRPTSEASMVVASSMKAVPAEKHSAACSPRLQHFRPSGLAVPSGQRQSPFLHRFGGSQHRPPQKPNPGPFGQQEGFHSSEGARVPSGRRSAGRPMRTQPL